MTPSSPPPRAARPARRKPTPEPLTAGSFQPFMTVIELAIVQVLGVEPLDLDPILRKLALGGPIARHVVLECLGALRQQSRIELVIGQGWCLPRSPRGKGRAVASPTLSVEILAGPARGTRLDLPPSQCAVSPSVFAERFREHAADPLVSVPEELRVEGAAVELDAALQRVGTTVQDFVPRDGGPDTCFVLFSASTGEPTAPDRWVRTRVIARTR